MILSDGSIMNAIHDGRLSVSPFTSSHVQPASVDVLLGDRFRVFNNHRHTCIDVRMDQPDLTREILKADDEPFMLHPGEFVLGSTVETLTLPDDLVARVEGKSSLGRLGLLVHATAGFVDPGFSGQITLELSNVANLPITLYPGMKIAQLAFLELDTPCLTPYGSASLGSKYQGQTGPTASQSHQNFAASS
jgi:dCTP deaminase